MIDTVLASAISFGMGLGLGLLAMMEANKNTSKELVESKLRIDTSSNDRWIESMKKEAEEHREKLDELYNRNEELGIELSKTIVERDVYKAFFDGWKATQTIKSDSAKMVTVFDATQNDEPIPEGLVRTPNTEQPKQGNKFASEDGMSANDRREKAYWLSVIGHDIPSVMQLANIKSASTCKKYISEGKKLVTDKYSVKRNVRNPETGQLEEKMVPDFVEVTDGEKVIEVPRVQVKDGIWQKCKDFYEAQNDFGMEDEEVYEEE